MIVIALYALLAAVCAVGLWGLYLMYCALHASMRNGKLHATPWPVRALSYALLAFMVTADAVFNLTIGSLLFWEWPRSWMFTTRCSSHLADSGWRGDIARWICDGWLNPFEADHCRS